MTEIEADILFATLLTSNSYACNRPHNGDLRYFPPKTMRTSLPDQSMAPVDADNT